MDMNLRAILIILAVLFAPWCFNVYKFTQCDFVSSYKCELVHGIGIAMPPISWVAVWFGTDEDS